ATGTGVPYCGDGVAHGTEECDDGNAVAGDGCELDCLITVCTSGLAIENAELVMSGFYSGPRKLSFKGRLPFGPGEPAGYDPASTGAQVRFRALGASSPFESLVFDRSIMPVPANSAGRCDPLRDGWRSAGAKTTYRNRSGAIDPPTCTPGSAGGLTELSFTKPGMAPFTKAQVKATGWSGYFGGQLEVVNGADTTLGGCARVVFTGSQCETLGAHRQKIRCRSD